MRLMLAAFGHVLDIGFGKEPDLEEELEEVEEEEDAEQSDPPAHTPYPMEVFTHSPGAAFWAKTAPSTPRFGNGFVL